jgi:hypothetical protein
VKELDVNDTVFDTAARTLAATGSRRATLRLAASAVLGAIATRWIPAAAASVEVCRGGGARCQQGAQCCSGTCKKRRGKRSGTCRRFGNALAGNCAPIAMCQEQRAPVCRVIDGNGQVNDGKCYPVGENSAICARTFACDLISPICQNDADCAAAGFGPDSLCIPCGSAACKGGAACVVYAGAASAPERRSR